MQVQPIGYVQSPVQEAVDHAWGPVIAEIHLEPALAAGLQGLEAFSHLLVLFWMHQSHFDPQHHLLRRPQGRDDMPQCGIFAQRARHRPNPLGVTAVTLLNVAPPVLTVRGLDAIDGTPVLDIKPYFPVFDRVETAHVPEWVPRLMHDYF